VILTPKEADLQSNAVLQVKLLWEAAGAKIEYMPAELHDRIYAYVSHLPQLVAFAARESINKMLHGDADEAFKRFARLTHSNPLLWADISLANADYVSNAMEDFITFATQIAGELSESNEESNGDANIAADLFPKIVATCLIAAASSLEEQMGIHPARFAGSGFADMTAPALDDPEAALAAISAHHKHITQWLKMLIARLESFKKALRLSDRNGLVALFGK
jgi:prephenate dehydrogenase